jgi:membrane fusion protein (multidrug efflux system)
MKKKTVLSASALLLASCISRPAQQQAATPSLQVARVEAGIATTYQEYPATIDGFINVEIRPQVDGILEEVYVDEGSFVKKGQRLFKIDDKRFREKLANARAAELAAQGTLVSARLEVEKLTSLVENKVVSEFQLKTAKAALQVAEGNLAQAMAQIGTAEIDLGYTVVKAPVSGYIGRLPKKQGALVAPNDHEPLTRLSDVHEVRAYFSLGETDFVNFRTLYPGASLEEKIRHMAPVSLVLPDKKDYTVQGKVDMIDGQFDQTTAAITLRATFPNSEGLLRSGNTGKIRLRLDRDNIVRIPVASTIEMQDKVFIYIVSDSNKVAKQAINIIGKTGEDYLVQDGVRPGQRIVLTGIDRLQEGTVIDPKQQVISSNTTHQ